MTRALIASRLDYCNSVLYQISVNATTQSHNLQSLQSVLHSAARLVMRKRKFDNITPTLRDDLHWFPVPQRIIYTNPASLSTDACQVFAARDKRLCCRPAYQISSAIRVFFRISDIGGVNQLWGSPPLPFLLVPSPPPPLPSHPPILHPFPSASFKITP